MAVASISSPPTQQGLTQEIIITMVIGRLKRRISSGQGGHQLPYDDKIDSTQTQIPDHRESPGSSHEHEDGIIIESRLHPQHSHRDITDGGNSQLINHSPRRLRRLNTDDRSRRLCSAENFAYLIFFMALSKTCVCASLLYIILE